ncbi:MAG: response regulator [Planctomycetes bacterium]|nr:response regulator [Planctomycetota bacterium]
MADDGSTNEALLAEDWPDRDSPTSVLVVDDNLVMVKLLIQTLAPHGLTCHWAKTVDEAQHILNAYDIRIVISDIRQGFLDGVGLGRWIRNHPRTMDLPIVFFTSCSDRSTIQAAAALGNVDYVLKPLRPAAFSERILKRLAIAG